MTPQKHNIKNHIIKNIKSRLSGEVALPAATSEIINALAYACTFDTSRQFGAIDMTPMRWSELSDTLQVRELFEVADALERFELESGKPKNRLFYILGILARIYGRRQAARSAQNFIQRHYTIEELAAVATPIDTLKNLEL